MSSISIARSLDPAKLYRGRDESLLHIKEAIRSKIDHLTSILGANGIELQQIRSKKVIADENVMPGAEPTLPFDVNVYAVSTVNNANESKLFTRKGNLLVINRLFRESLKIWKSVQEVVANNSVEKFETATIAEIAAQVNLIGETVFNQILTWLWFYAPRNRSCDVVTLKVPGLPPASMETFLPVKLPLGGEPTKEAIGTIETTLKLWYEERRTSILLILVYVDDPNRQELVFDPIRLDPPELNHGKVMMKCHGKLSSFGRNIAAEVDRVEKLIAKYRVMRDAEKSAIDAVMVKFRNLIFFNQQISSLPVTVSSPQVFSSEVLSYAATTARQKPKKGKKVEPAVDTVPSAAMERTDAVAIERPKVALRDPDDYNTFRTMMGTDKKQVCWHDVVHCLKSLGYEITQNSGSNTWKFKWKTQAWLRDEKTIEELADEVEPTTVAATSMHVPHQGGLNTRGKLDTGRLSSFKKLLEESGFDLDCVTLKEKS